MFSIKFINEYLSSEEKNENSSYVEITIDEFHDKFLASHDYWDRKKYLHQWIEGLSKVIFGESNSLLITNMYDPQKANFIFTWLMYVIGEKVVFQNKLFILKELNEPFNENDPYTCIPIRITTTDEGYEISEWVTDIESLKEFYYSLVTYN